MSQQLKILILGLNYAPEPTGIAPYTARLAERLAGDDHDVRVITGYPHYPEWKLKDNYSGWSFREKINGVQVRRLRHFIPRRVTNIQRMHLEISFGLRVLFAKWENPDVVILVSPALFSTAFALVRARCGLRRPATGLWVQDIYSRGLEETSSGTTKSARIMKWIEGYLFRSATRVTVIHERFKEYLMSDLGVADRDLSVIRNWTHVEKRSPVDRESIRLKYDWAPDHVIVLHAGNIGIKQALGNVVDAARLADTENSAVRFVLLGDGNQRRNIEALADGIGHIQFLAPLPDKEFTEALAAADILLVNEMAGLREMAVPSKLTSYFSTGLPVIAATEHDSTTAEEIASSGGGIRIAPDDPVELLAAATRLGSDPELSARLGHAGLNFAENVLSEDTAIVQYDHWIKELAAAKR